MTPEEQQKYLDGIIAYSQRLTNEVLAHASSIEAKLTEANAHFGNPDRTSDKLMPPLPPSESGRKMFQSYGQGGYSEEFNGEIKPDDIPEDL